MPTCWLECNVEGTGSSLDPFRPSLGERYEVVEEVVEGILVKGLRITPPFRHQGWSAVYHPEKPPYEKALVRIETLSPIDWALFPALKPLKEKVEWDEVYDRRPPFKERWLDQPYKPASKHSTVETRYPTTTAVTVNGLAARDLSTTAGGAEYLSYRNAVCAGNCVAACRISYDIVQRTSGGSETVIGSKVGLVTPPTLKGVVSATWSCPQTGLATTDSIVQYLFWSSNSGSTWNTTMTVGYRIWTTEQLGEEWLDAATWTIYTECSAVYIPPDFDFTRITWWCNDSDSRIEGFSHSTPAVAKYIHRRIGSPVLSMGMNLSPQLRLE